MRNIFGEMDNLSPLAGLKINHDLYQGLTPLAIFLPALRACDDGV